MRGKLVIYVLGLLALTLYLVSPLAAAWAIRDAIHNGDTAVLERRIDWPGVKSSLKASMESYALGIEPTALGSDAPRPSLWNRIKIAYGRSVVASVVDRMVTPTGLPKLLKYRNGYHRTVHALPDDAEGTLIDEVRAAWQRIERAEFLSPTRFAIQVRDRIDPDKSFAGVLALQGGEWRLVSLEVVGRKQPGTLARAWSAMKQAAIR